jgi:hypothetical protein
MISVHCTKCQSELEEPGALMFSPPGPFSGAVRKYHLCVTCWDEVMDFALGIRGN